MKRALVAHGPAPNSEWYIPIDCEAVGDTAIGTYKMLKKLAHTLLNQWNSVIYE